MVKKWLPWVVKGGLSVGLTAWVLSKVDLGAAWLQAKAIDPWTLLLALALLTAQVGLGAIRWGMVLHALESRLGWAKTQIGRAHV